MVYCAVFGCYNDSKKEKNVCYHQFPLSVCRHLNTADNLNSDRGIEPLVETFPRFYI